MDLPLQELSCPGWNKRCPRCEWLKPYAAFYPRKAGTVPSYGNAQSHCKACHRQAERARNQAIRANPEAWARKQEHYRARRKAMREAKKRWYAKMKADPERYKQYLKDRREALARKRQSDPEWYQELRENRRLTYALRRYDAGKPYTPKQPVQLTLHRVPKEPFIEWLDTLPMQTHELEQASGVPARSLYRIRNEGGKVTLDLVERVVRGVTGSVDISFLYGEDVIG